MKIGELIEQVRGVSYKKAQSTTTPEDGHIPVLRANNIQEDGLHLDDFVYVPNELVKPKQKLREGDILVATSSGSIKIVGKACVVNQDMEAGFGAFCKVLRPSSENVAPKFLGYYFRTPEYRKTVSNLAAGANINNLKTEHFDDLEIALPPIETQRKIAAILDTADAYRQKTKALIEKYDALAQSLFLDMFGDPVRNPKGWETQRLEKICGVGSSKRVFVDHLVEEGVPFYRGTEVGQLGAGETISPTLFITEEHYKELKNHTGIPEIGDLLMPSICPDGRIMQVQDEKPFYFKDGRVLWIKVDSNVVNSSYLRFFLKALFKANYEKIASGTTFAELKIFALKAIEVLMPPINLQEEFSVKYENLSKQLDASKSAVNESEELFNSLLQKAFKGELA